MDKRVIRAFRGIINTPFLLQADALSSIVASLENIFIKGGQIVNPSPDSSGANKDRSALYPIAAKQPRELKNNIAIIPVHNVLAHRTEGFISYLFGDTSYEEIREAFQEALNDKTVGAIVFDIDSPGGEIAGAFDLVDEIYQARGIKPIYAIANEDAFSAAYAIASAAEKIYIARTGSVGSIGVVSFHVDQSAWDASEGLKYNYIYAGAHKIDYSPHQPLSDEARSAAQRDVDDTYELFVETVARNRGLTADAVRMTEAAFFRGKKAIQAKLADAIMSFDKAIADITQTIKSKGGTKNMSQTFKEKAAALFSEASQEELLAALTELGFLPAMTPEAKAADTERIKTEAEKEALTRVNGIMDICSLGGMEISVAAKMVSDGTTIEAARTKVMELKAEASRKQAIRSTTGALSTGEVNPLIADARSRADKKI
jgi:signal peptide peptidase SppA